MDIEPLLRPMRLRGLELPNRVVMSPMSRYASPDGVPGPDVVGYYARRAAHGVGLVVTEGVAIDHPLSVDHPAAPRLFGADALAGWSGVVTAVHAAGGRIWPQLWHQGPMWNVESTRLGVRTPSLRPSGIWGPADGTISIPAEAKAAALPVTLPAGDGDIQDVIDAYGRAAGAAKRLGFDGIAIHGAHGYLIDSFLWSFTNRRDDGWGGDAERRAAFGAAVVRAVRAAVGPDMPICLRLSQFKMQDYRAVLADNPDDLGRLLRPLADAGVDLFDGSQRYFDTPVFDGSALNLAGWMRLLTGVPSMAVGGVGLDKARGPARHIDDSQTATNNLDRVLARMRAGEFDLIAVGRSLLNDPCWLERVRTGQPFLPFDPANLQRLT
ncbi:12-oxophytodienoate reductase [Niveispirillum fermenti]|uniref:oxidoreductase n=2 Tax=Niveispirillum fermenti TaxID=1233113 RepID=UPI003A85ACBE